MTQIWFCRGFVKGEKKKKNNFSIASLVLTTAFYIKLQEIKMMLVILNNNNLTYYIIIVLIHINPIIIIYVIYICRDKSNLKSNLRFGQSSKYF